MVKKATKYFHRGPDKAVFDPVQGVGKRFEVKLGSSAYGPIPALVDVGKQKECRAPA